MQNIQAPVSFNSDNQDLIYAYKESYIKCRDVFLGILLGLQMTLLCVGAWVHGVSSGDSEMTEKSQILFCISAATTLVAVWMYLGRLKILQSFSVKLADRGIKAEEILYK